MAWADTLSLFHQNSFSRYALDSRIQESINLLLTHSQFILINSDQNKNRRKERESNEYQYFYSPGSALSPTLYSMSPAQQQQ